MKVRYILNHILNIFIGIFALVLLTSYMPRVNRSPNSCDSNSNFFFQISGSVNKQLNGKMRFETSEKKTNRGVVFSILRLDLENSLENKFVLFISKANTSDLIEEGVYEITKEMSKSINQIDGVFGYLNIEKSDELPFYAENGKIIIEETNNDVIKGYLNMSLENFSGDMISVSGNFIANSLN